MAVDGSKFNSVTRRLPETYLVPTPKKRSITRAETQRIKNVPHARIHSDKENKNNQEEKTQPI